MAETSEGQVPSPAYVDPFRAFRTEMDKLAETFFGRNMGLPWTAGGDGSGIVMPLIDVKDNQHAVVLSAELPGVDEQDVEVTVKNGMLLLKGEKKHSYEKQKDNLQIMERRYGTVERVMPLPEMVDAAKIEAKFDKGVLTITMPKRPEAAPAERRIEITH